VTDVTENVKALVSNIAEVMRTASAEGGQMPLQRILIAVDDEPVAAQAADVGIELAGKLAAEIALVHVVDPKGAEALEGGMSAPDLVAFLEAEAKRMLAAFRTRLPSQLITHEFIPKGRPATEIVNAAKQWNADFIVIGTHGRCGMTRALLGSVAEQVIRNAPCPVIAVRAKC
jgi:universal stress protein A